MMMMMEGECNQSIGLSTGIDEGRKEGRKGGDGDPSYDADGLPG